jgi:hypothetical protein
MTRKSIKWDKNTRRQDAKTDDQDNSFELSPYVYRALLVHMWTKMQVKHSQLSIKLNRQAYITRANEVLYGC